MATESLHSALLQNPNAIPPRTSSINYGLAGPKSRPFRSHSSGKRSTHAGGSHLNRYSLPLLKANPSNPVLHPVSENDWLASKNSSHPALRPPAPLATDAPSDVKPPKEVIRTSAQTHTQPSTPTEEHRDPLAMSQPPPDPINGYGDDLIYGRKPTWSDEKEKILMGPYDYMYGNPGKDIRKQLIAAFDLWLKVPPESLAVITRVVGMLHTASLLVDDVEDSSLLRRGVPVAHSIFGTAQTINSANYVYFLALKELTKLKSPKANDIYTEELLNLHRGQGMDLYWRDTLTCPEENDYLEMVGNKTGGLFRLAVRLMMAEGRVSVDCIPLASAFSLLFQILDDYLNLSSPLYTAQKTLCEDLTEGKFSFPVIHAIRADPSNLSILNILKQKTKDEDVKRYAVAYMERVGSFDYTRRVMRDLSDKAEFLVGQVERTVGGENGRRGAEGVRSILARMKVN